MSARFLSFSRDSRAGWGLMSGDGVIDLTGRSDLPGLQAAVGAGALAALADRWGGTSPDIAATDVTFEPPILAPQKILCVGVNYPDRNAEYKDGSEAPTHPSLFVRFPGSFTGHGQPLIRPPESHQLDYEGEVVLVIGRPGRRIAERDALSHVAGLTLANEGTLRDWVRHGKFNVTQGKNFDRSGAIGPWLVPFTDEAQIADIRLTTRVNGELRQDDRTSRMVFSFRRLIAYISTFTTLVPGDVILCGTPSGAGARLDPPVWLKPGDAVEVEAEGIGRLVNGVEDEA
jgi:2-keto-4-pentenoate hydratase/2-oxohepta-3-ene-1,7-dioic acid hydratase in catechol pathway